MLDRSTTKYDIKYDTFRAAGVPVEEARKAATAPSSTELWFDKLDAKIDRSKARSMARSIGWKSVVEGDLTLLKWMTSFLLAFVVVIPAKLFLH